VDVPAGILLAHLTAASNYLNARLSGRTLDEARTDVLREIEEQLQSLKSLGQDVGSAIGSAFFSIVNGAANARQALAGLLQQFVAIAQQRAIQGIANSLGNAFGASTAQQISNVQSGGVNVPAQPGGGLAGGGIG
jgi:heat-inducible transcriptional repressor